MIGHWRVTLKDGTVIDDDEITHIYYEKKAIELKRLREWDEVQVKTTGFGRWKKEIELPPEHHYRLVVRYVVPYSSVSMCQWIDKETTND